MINDVVAGNRVLIARTRAGITQDELARQMTMRGCSVGFPTISKIEKGSRALKLTEAVTICDALSITLDDLWGGEPVPVKPLPAQKENALTGVNESIKALQALARTLREN